MPPADDPGTQIPTPLQRITDLESQVKELNKHSIRRDPVSPRMLALVTVVALLSIVGYLGGIKVLTVEVIAAILGAIAGRLTSNIGGASDSEEVTRKP